MCFVRAHYRSIYYANGEEKKAKGKIYKTVIDKERAFEYKGEDVEAMPHIVDEIFHRIELAGKKHDSDIVENQVSFVAFWSSRTFG